MAAKVRLTVKQPFNYGDKAYKIGEEWEPTGHEQDRKILDNFIRVEIVEVKHGDSKR